MAGSLGTPILNSPFEPPTALPAEPDFDGTTLRYARAAWLAAAVVLGVVLSSLAELYIQEVSNKTSSNRWSPR